MQLAVIVLIILAILYVPFYIWVRYSPKAERYGLKKYGPAIMLRTKLGMRLIEKYSKYNRFWRFFGTLSLVLSFILMIAITYILVAGVLNLPTTLRSDGMGIEYALAIPGLNPLLPVGFGIVGLIVAVCLHELAHGMQTASNGMRVDSTGLLHFVIPMGAFVEPNEEDVEKSNRRVKLDLYTAGISTNFIVGSICFMLFAVVMLGGISSPYGDSAAVYSMTSGSSAYDNGIPNGCIIETVDGSEFILTDDYTYTYSWNPGDDVTVAYITENGKSEATITWGVYIEKVVNNSPANEYLKAKWYLLSISNLSIGKTFDLSTANQFSAYMKTTNAGDHVSITYLTDDGLIESTPEFELSSKNGTGYLGISTTTSGMNFKTPNQVLDIARNPFYGDSSLTDYATSAISYISGPFNGFSPVPSSVQWWYDVPFEGVFWWFAGLFYWIFWLNIILGVSNAIPAVPFDGGFIFYGMADWTLEKIFRMEDKIKREELADRITSYVSMFVILIFILVIVAAVL